MQPHNLNRRSILKLGAFALAGSATLVPTPNETAQAQAQGFTLPRVKVAENLIARQVAGFRPFRASGFVVKTETMGDKTIIHDYGHGGCGVTLSWGTADMAVNMALQTSHRTAAVLGCGAVGLATARLLQDRGFQVTIYAKDLPPETTSNVAGAMFGATSIVADDQHTPAITTQLAQAVRYAHRYFQNFVGDKYGVHWNEMFLIGDDPQTQPWEFSITSDLFPFTDYGPGEHPFPTKYASSFRTMMIEPFTYLPQIMSDFILRGGKLIVQSFPDVAAVLKLTEPLIMNCTGMGAKELFGDK